MRLLLVSLLLALIPLSPLGAELTVSFGAGAVTVEGVSPGGSVALLGIAKEPGHYRASVTYRRELLSDADADGVLSYPLERRAPATSVWAFVDVVTGSVAVATPEAGVMTEVPFPEQTSLRDVAGEFVLVDDRRAELELLYVRPLVGAWRSEVSDGAPSDGDGATDGRIRINLRGLEALGGGLGSVARALPGDLVVGIDRYKGEYFVLELDASVGR